MFGIKSSASLLLFFYLGKIASDPMMIIFWGAPNSWKTCSYQKITTNFQKCWTACYNDVDCIAAYQVNSTLCVYCEWDDLTSVTQLDPETTKVAVKMNMTNATCPAGNITTFAQGQSIKVLSYYYQAIMENKITVTGNTLNFNIIVTDVCNGTGNLYPTSLGWRCFYFWYYHTPANYTSAVSSCAGDDTILVPLETSSVTAMIINSCNTLNGSTTITLRIDGVKREECHNSTESDCQGISAYNFINDTYLTTYSGMVFLQNTTGLDTGNCTYADCLQLLYLGLNDPRSGTIMEVCCDVPSNFAKNVVPFLEGIICGNNCNNCF